MTSSDHIRETAMALPEVEERTENGRTAYLLDGHAFAVVEDDTLRVRADEANEQAVLLDGGATSDASAWFTTTLADDTDPHLIEDRIARGWELVAPARLLEAGGR